MLFDQPKAMPFPAMPMMGMARSAATRGAGPVDVAITHGEVEGDFYEGRNYKIERDPRLPIRVTVQFYKGISAGATITDDDMREFRRQIDRVYAEGDYVGSLVLDGHSGRPTEHNISCGYETFPWWSPIWPYRLSNGTTYSADEAVSALQARWGRVHWWRWVCEGERKLKSALQYLGDPESVNRDPAPNGTPQ